VLTVTLGRRNVSRHKKKEGGDYRVEGGVWGGGGLGFFFVCWCCGFMGEGVGVLKFGRCWGGGVFAVPRGEPPTRLRGRMPSKNDPVQDQGPRKQGGRPRFAPLARVRQNAADGICQRGWFYVGRKKERVPIPRGYSV